MLNKPPRNLADSSSNSPWRVHSVNFERDTDDWLESVVALLREAGIPKAGRSEVVRLALSDLRRAIDGRSRAETVKFFLDRDAERRLALLDPPHSDNP